MKTLRLTLRVEDGVEAYMRECWESDGKAYGGRPVTLREWLALKIEEDWSMDAADHGDRGRES